ncbi:MAG: biotin/lipoyl-binding protein [Ignavibacteria bacterium]|jgi:biotin carboxyl carrier protein|nr:biotin/lipoyl-binding protein [Ignavibacteria bacterium]MCU7500574.1 biotin/lipoyl-binding protein [Ignavibacteria bacterium]MCU7513719.1 biotin/lipoyl-binding protein [Ignavibacteria bacterium]MCU7519580.1 biotin/lipoyl-binding protein [Ignavibacteria bacterium]MCU7525455.1 biotin/lipoyl-binding protein [Ignavibacteria bacterium]
MKKFRFKINANQYDVDIVNVEDNVAEVVVNGTTYHVEVEQKIQTTKTPTLVRSKAEPSTDIHKSVARTSNPSTPKGTGTIKSPLPGTVLKIHVKEGDFVKIGDRLMTLEAMKMENNINSDKEGLIKAIKVTERDSVLEGDVLMEIGS